MAVLWYAALAVAVCVGGDVAVHGPLFRRVFSRLIVFLARHRTVGALLGVRYYRSDAWATTRAEAKLAVSSFITRLLGIKFEFGNRAHINALKTRQRQFTRPLDLAPYMLSLLGQKLSVAQLMDFLVDTWVEEAPRPLHALPPFLNLSQTHLA